MRRPIASSDGIEKNGCKKYAEESDAQHAAKDGLAQRMAHLGTGSKGEDQRQHAENECKRRHENGPQPELTRLQGCIADVHAFFLALLGKLHDQDRVLAGQADQHDEPDLGEDIHLHPGQVQARHRAEEAHRHDQDDGQRQRPAFILRGENQEHEGNSQREDEDRRLTRLILHVRKFRPV